MNSLQKEAVEVKFELVSEHLEEWVLDAFIAVLDRLKEQSKPALKWRRQKDEDLAF